MGRGKLALDLIEKEKPRMITYQKRKRGLKKKAQEFATLCGVPTCMIIYGPRLNNCPADVEIWPKDEKKFMEVVNLYRDKAFSSVRGVKSQNLYDFFADRNRKVHDKIVKIRKANFEAKFSCDLDEEFNNLSLHQLKELLILFDNNIDVATRKLALLKGHQQNFGFYNNNDNNNNNNGAQVFFQPQPQPLASHHFNMQLVPYPPHPHHLQALQLVPFELSPVDNPRMAMMFPNGGDQIHQMGSVAPNNLPMQHGVRYDPMGAMIENQVTMNNHMVMNHQFPAFPGIGSPQFHDSQFSGFYGDPINNFYYKRENL